MSRPRPASGAGVFLPPHRSVPVVLARLCVAALCSLLAEPPAHALTLEQAVQLATQRNETGLAALALADAADARVGKARSFFFPNVGADSVYTRRAWETTQQSGGETYYVTRRDALSARGFFSQTLLDMRAIPVWRAAKADREAARLEAADARRIVGFEAADAFLQTVGYEKVRDAAKRRLDYAQHSLNDARTRFEAQLVSSNDVTRAELELASAERELAAIVGQAETARLNLGYVIASPVEDALVVPSDLETPAAVPAGSPADLVTEALGRRPDLAARGKRVEALRLFAEEPMNRWYPVLGAAGEYRWTNETGLSGRSTNWFVAATLTWSVFDGLVRYAEARERKDAADASELIRAQRTRQAAVEVQSSLATIDAARASVKQATVAFAAARKNADETAELYRQGLSTALAAADASLRLFEAEAALVRERVGLAIATLSLRSAIGLDALGKELP